MRVYPYPNTGGLPESPFTVMLDGERVNVSAPAFEDQVRSVYDEARKVLLERHKKYGPKNISMAPGGALNGLRVRMHDKLARINYALDTHNEHLAEPADDPFRDSFLDLANYALIGLLVVDGKWPQ